MKRMLIDDTQPEETRVVIVDGNKVEDVEFESSLRKQIKGNIFTAKVVRIEPSLQAAFVDYGGNRHGFLAFGEIHPDYYNVSDEIKAEVEKEVDEIIEKKRQFQAERKAEQERRQRTDRLDTLLAEIREYEQSAADIQSWAAVVRKHLHIRELDRETVDELIDRIEVGEKTVIDGKNVRDIKIYYCFVGNI